MYILNNEEDNLNKEGMVNGDSYTNNNQREKPFGREFYFWHKDKNTW